MNSLALLLTLSFLTMRESSAKAECERAPANVRLLPTNTPKQEGWREVERLLAVTNPGSRIRLADSHRDHIYLEEKGSVYAVYLHFDRDEESGYAALVLNYASKHDSALTSGEKMTGNGCHAQVELVLARMDTNGSPQIIARGQLDDEASTIDVRTMEVDREDGEPVVKFMYHAYYGTAAWFGYVTWRAAVSLERGRLITHRLPATYVKVSGPGRDQMQGYLAPAGGDPSRGIARLLTMAFGAKGEVEKEFDVPLIDRRWISGMEIMRRVP